MDGKNTLKDYKIVNESVICMRLHGELKIFVNSDTGKTTTFIVKASTKIERLKDLIKDSEGSNILLLSYKHCYFNQVC